MRPPLPQPASGSSHGESVRPPAPGTAAAATPGEALTAARRSEPGPAALTLLLEVDGMKCAGCLRAVEQRLAHQPGVRQVSVSLLTRTAWLELEPGSDPAIAGQPGDGGAGELAEEDLQSLAAPLLASLGEMGFPSRLRPEGPVPLSRRDRLKQQAWWQRWRHLFVALSLVLISAVGHAAESGVLPHGEPFGLLANPWLHGLVATVALLGPGGSILRQGWLAAWAGMPSMDSLVGLGMASAWLASVVGLLWPASGWPCFFNEPVMLLGFVLVGRFLEERARWRTGRAIEELVQLQPDQALLLVDAGPPRQVRVGGLRPEDRILVLPGDRVPVDGVVLEGESSLDLSALTGESQPVAADPGQEVSAGSLNLTAPLQMRVSRSGADSAIARIVQLVEKAQARKAPIQGLADRVAGRFALAVLLLAVATLLFWWLVGSQLWPQVLHVPAGSALAMHGAHGGAGMAAEGQLAPLTLALQLAIAVLVVACPCALGLATPTAISVGCGRAARAGLLFRGGDAIETASALRAVLFDKTGTLTLGRPLVTAVEPVPPFTADQLVQLAASLEGQSRHPLAHALLQEAGRRQLPQLDLADHRSFSGDGLMALWPAPPAEGWGLEATPSLAGPNLEVRIGRLSWLEDQAVRVGESELARQRQLEADGATVVGVAAGREVLGLLAVQDQPRSDAAATVAELRQRGLGLGLLSGDRRLPVERLGQKLGFRDRELAWELRPEQKLQRILVAHASGAVAMVGDGINDAPALAAADLGVAVGTGTQIAQECADLLILGDHLSGLITALDLARSTMAKVRQNLAWAFGYNLIVLPLAAGVLLPGFGLRLTPPLAALLMACSSITVVVNALLLPNPGPPQGSQR